MSDAAAKSPSPSSSSAGFESSRLDDRFGEFFLLFFECGFLSFNPLARLFAIGLFSFGGGDSFRKIATTFFVLFDSGFTCGKFVASLFLYRERVLFRLYFGNEFFAVFNALVAIFNFLFAVAIRFLFRFVRRKSDTLVVNSRIRMRVFATKR